MLSQEDIDIIDLYIKNELKGDALLHFQSRLESEPDFANEVNAMKEISNGIRQYGRIQLKIKLKEISDTAALEEGVAAATIAKRSFKLYYAIAAVFLLVIGFTLVFKFMSDPNKNISNNLANNSNDTLLQKIQADSIIKNIKGTYFPITTVPIDGSKLGYANVSVNPSKISINFITDAHYTTHYILSDSSLYILAKFNQSDIIVYEKPDALILNNLKDYYLINKSLKNSLRRLVLVQDPFIIKECEAVKK